MKKMLFLVLWLLPCWLSAQIVDSAALRQVDSLIQVISTLQSNREYDRALQMLEEIQPFVLEKAGRESVQYAGWLTRKGVILATKNDIKGAEKWLLEAEDIHKRVLGEIYPDYFRVLYGLGAFVYFRTNDSLCESYLTRAKAFLEKTDGRKQIEYSKVLSALGNFYSLAGQLNKAETIFIQSLTFIEDMKGRENSDYTLALENLSKIYYKQARFQDAIAKITESQNIKAKTLGTKHPDYAKSLHNLAVNYKETGAFEQAESLYQQALNIIESSSGRNNIQYTQILESFAIFYISVLDDFEKAEQLMTTAREIMGNLPNGKANPSYFNVTKNIATLYLKIGDFKKSEVLFKEAQLFLTNVGKDNFDYVSLLSDIVLLYNKQHQYEKSEQVCRELMAIEKKRTSTETQLYAHACLMLGNNFLSRGEYVEAEKVLQESVDIYARVLGKETLFYGEALTNLAQTCQKLAQYDRAEQYYQEVLELQEKMVGKQHSDRLSTLQGLAQLYTQQGQPAKASAYWIAFNQLRSQLAEKAATYMSEYQMLAYLKTFEEGIHAFYHFVQQYPTLQHCALVYDNSLFFNGLLLDNARRLATESNRSDSLTRATFARWQNCQRYLAVQYAKPLAEHKRVAETEEEAQNLEKDLTRRLVAFGSFRRAPHWQEVQQNLRPNEAAVEYIHYRSESVNSTLYAALVVLPNANAPQFIPLCEEKQLTSLLKTEGKPQPDFYNDLYAADKKGTQLYDLIWKPIAAALPEGTTVYCSPSGLLHRINLAAIPAPDGKILAEKNHLTMLGSTRQLVVPQIFASNQNATAQLYGGILYDATPVIAASTKPQTDDMASRRSLDFIQADSTLRGETWNYLRWTEVEISTAAAIMEGKGIAPTVKKGAEATEESFKTIGISGPSPRVLHVATHGFFFPDPKEGKSGGEEKVFKVSDNPMIRSGLVLAGGNQAWKTGKPLRPDLEDGILTAYEISQMNLSNTELVVLSACETGLGDLLGNEGVYGLQRAFKIAGARYLIMSLWQVPDFQTQVFMTAFYKHWLEGKMAIPEAFRTTQSELKAKYGEAFKWAGFVLVE